MPAPDWKKLADDADHGNRGLGEIVRAVEAANQSNTTMLRLTWAILILTAIAALGALPVLWQWIKSASGN
jgi:hypothetical protein